MLFGPQGHLQLLVVKRGIRRFQHLRIMHECGKLWTDSGAMIIPKVLTGKVCELYSWTRVHTEKPLGVQYELNEREHKLPPEKRYIQTVVYKGDVKCDDATKAC